MMPALTPKSDLTAWLERLERLHPREIDLGLERVGAVADALGLTRPEARVVTVAGTNGKGSVCHLIAAILTAAGHRVGLYTSPHLVRFNERVRIDGADASDAALCAAFERVERARGATTLTFFEFATLAALDVFATERVDVLVLEVGLGGRLDATNIVGSDVAVVTSVAIDHAEWLGEDRDAIAREKAGIARPGRPLVLGESDPAPGLLDAAVECGAELRRPGVDYAYAEHDAGWRWRGREGRWLALPLPGVGGGYQLGNAATALAALDALEPVPPAAIAEGLRAARVPGRFEVLSGVCAPAGPIEVILDVAHNPAAATTLVRHLAAAETRPTRAVVAMYADKDFAGVAAALMPAIDAWYPAGLPEPRGAPVERLVAAIEAQGGRVATHANDPVAAFEAARVDAAAGDRLLVLGSFATVGPIREHLLPAD